MGTHPIFESDFDCLTDMLQNFRICGNCIRKNSFGHSKNYYKILGIENDATKTEIQKAYKKLVLKTHPDRFPGEKSKEEEFKVLNEAYSTLLNAEKREEYNRSLNVKN